MTTFPATASGGMSRESLKGIATTTRSPKRAASSAVVARAGSPSSAARSLKVSGPRELLMATSCPASVKWPASVDPMWPAPMMPIFISLVVCPARARSNAPLRGRSTLGLQPGVARLDHFGELIGLEPQAPADLADALHTCASRPLLQPRGEVLELGQDLRLGRQACGPPLKGCRDVRGGHAADVGRVDEPIEVADQAAHGIEFAHASLVRGHRA